MISMEYAKFMLKFNNKMLPDSFDNYFIKLENVHSYNTRQKHRNEYFQSFVYTVWCREKNTSSYLFKDMDW